MAKSREFCTGTVVSGHVDQRKAGQVFSDTLYSRDSDFLASSSSFLSPKMLSMEPRCAYSSPDSTAYARIMPVGRLYPFGKPSMLSISSSSHIVPREAAR